MRQLPQDIIERVDRVREYHRLSKLSPESVRAHPTVLDPSTHPSPFRVFDDLPSVALPTKLLDAPTSMGELLAEGLGAVAESHLRPPQDLKTLASWLFLANGLAARNQESASHWLRTCPSAGALYPFEIYVAAFGIEGLEPGLYHYNARDFALSRLRDGSITLATVKRGRPDLNFVKNVPALLLVSTIFWRSAWRYRQRGYRMALLDAGHLMQNLVCAGNGLGIATVSRLQVNEKTMRELIGVPTDADFGALESVQGMVVWADEAKNPLRDVPAAPTRAALPSIERPPLSSESIPYGSIAATQADCVAPGVALREIRPPLTELAPLIEGLKPSARTTIDPPLGPSLRQAMLTRRSVRGFDERSISRDQFVTINRLAFRGGSMFPMMPDGPHVALLRPYWMCHIVAGMDAGLWYYDPTQDRLSCLERGDFHKKSAQLCGEQSMFLQASAVCFLMADLKFLMNAAGPDPYRLAHLEAGIAGQRVCLGAAALGIAACGVGDFYDDEIRKFCALETTGWEPIYGVAVGHAMTS